MEWNTTSTVLKKLRDYDAKTAWELLDKHFQGALVQFGGRMGLSPADAQDAAQETLITFAQAYREGNYDKEKGRLKSWLYGIAKRQCMKVRGKVTRQRDRGHGEQSDDSQPLEQIAAEGDDLADLWEEEWRRMVYARALECVRSEVTPDTFEMFQQVVFKGQTNDEVAEEFGVERAKVYDAKYRVTRRLAQLAGEYEDA